jgi:signal transduction histidine kinase
VAGQGLGVGIARQIAQAYGGGLTLERSPTLKGLRASLRLGGVLD